VIAALLLGAVNLLAVGPTVKLLSGGPNSAGLTAASGYVNGDITTGSKYHTPCGLAVDITGNYILVADRDNNAVRLLEFDINSTFTLLTMTNYVLATNLFIKPVGVAIDSSYNVFVLNYGKGTNGYVMEFDSDGELIATNICNLTNAAGIALDTSDDVFVTASNKVFKITPFGVSNVVATITAPGASLQGIVAKRSGPTAGLLAVCDSGRNGILLIDPNTGTVTTNSGFHGIGDFTSGNNTSISNTSKFFQPTGVAEAGDGTLVVTDFGNHRVKVVLASGSVTNVYGVISNDWVYFNTPPWQFPGYVDGTVVVPDQLGGVAARQPSGVAFAPDGTLYVTEDYYHIIRHITASFPPPPPPPPGSPTGLSAVPGYGQVTLTWVGSAGATNYNIKRSTSSGGETTFASTNGTIYIDRSVLDGTTYFYVVSAVNAGGESPPSTEASAAPLFSPAPTNLIVVTTNFGLVSLAWAPSAGATSYNLKRSPSHLGPYAIIASIASTSYNDTSVSNGTPYFYVVTAVNGGGENPTNSNEVSATPPLPPVPNPQIGWVTFPPPNSASVFNVGTPAGDTFNNDVPIVIEFAQGSQAFYNYANTTVITNIPDPTSGSTPALQGYMDGLTNLPAGLMVAQILPDLGIKAIGEQFGHPNSAVVSALFQFVVGNPSISGNNAAQFTVSSITVGAQMYYTSDGTDPTNDGSGTSIGPVVSGQTLSINFGVNTNVLFKIRGFKANYHPSTIVSNLFQAANFVPNIMSFGFASGPGSSKFVASPGQSFVLPVGLSLLPNPPPIYGLQFNVTLTNLGSSFVNPANIGFVSLLGKPDVPADGYYQTIPPYYFISASQPNNDPNAVPYGTGWYQGLVFTDTNNETLLGVGWLEVYGRTNLYDTTTQNLLTYPILRGNDPYPASQSIVGGYSFGIPTNANPGDVYQVQIGRPSATTFSGLNVNPYGTPVDIEAPANTNLLGPGSVNALKNVTIGQIKYLVGDVYPANWFNAGDFGSSNLVNVDVIRVFDFAAYPIAQPPVQSDLFDALDSSGNIGVLDGATGYWTNTVVYPYFTNYPNAIVDYTYTYDTNGNLASIAPGYTANFSSFIYMTTYYVTVPYVITNIYQATPPAVPTTNVVQTSYTINIPAGNPTLFSGNDSTINQIAFGDGVLDVCDVYVTFRRSLDTNNLVWFQRFWTNSMRVATVTNASAVIAGAIKQSSGSKFQPAVNFGNSAPGSITNVPVVNFSSGDVQTTAGKTVQIPITASAVGPYPLRVAMLNISVVPLDGSPALTTPISFSPGALGSPSSGFTASTGNGNYAAAWLNSAITGISNNATIGTLNVTVPANATSSSSYAIHFDRASGSPNGLASLPKHTWTGLITLSSRSTSSYKDGIPDSWRLRWFGTTNNWLSVSNASPSGDGINNWKKYVAGVDPNTRNDFPGVKPNTPTPAGAAMSIYWPTISGKQYAILSSASLFPGNWTTNATITGNGGNMEFDDHSTGAVKFYRVLVQP
jgi:sugar lactone lactonase YvrE